MRSVLALVAFSVVVLLSLAPVAAGAGCLPCKYAGTGGKEDDQPFPVLVVIACEGEAARGQIPARHAKAFHAISEAQWRSAVAELDARLPSLSDEEVPVAFRELVARVGDAHTSLACRLPQGDCRSPCSGSGMSCASRGPRSNTRPWWAPAFCASGMFPFRKPRNVWRDP